MDKEKMVNTDERINKNHQFIIELKKLIQGEVDIEDQLCIIQLIALCCSELVTGIYADCYLENELIKAGQTIDFYRTKKRAVEKILIVMTGAYAIGGHTIVANNWIKWDSTHRFSLVVTNMKNDKIPDFLLDAVNDSGGDVYSLTGNYVEKAKQLLDISQEYSRIILMQHAHDIIPNLAYGNEKWDTPVYLYNHANFRFSLGYGVSDIVLNLTDYDKEKTCEYRGVETEKSIYLQPPNMGIAIREDYQNVKKNIDTNTIFEKYSVERNGKLIVSMGDDYKYKKIVGCDFADYVERVIHGTTENVQFLIIGADKEKERWISLNKRTHGKARALGYLPREEAKILITNADLYISSFPMTSFGAKDAEEAEVPFIVFDLIGRCKDVYSENIIVDSMEKLIQKSLDILNGNSEKSNNRNMKLKMEQNEWCEQWTSICNKYDTHKVINYSPNRIIGKEELINCQLMQETGARNIRQYLFRQYFGIHFWKKLVSLDEKYDMDIMPAKCGILEEDKSYYLIDELSIKREFLYKKCDKLYSYAAKWLGLHLNGVRIYDYLLNRGYRRIAIYGFGKMGENLVRELKNSDVYVAVIIDKKLAEDNQYAGYNIINSPEYLDEVDVIINTTAFSNDEIERGFPSKYQMISLFEIIDDLDEK